MPGLENMHINKLKEFLQMIFEIIKQTHSGSENEKDLLVLRNFLNIKENSDFINSATRSKTTVFTKTSLRAEGVAIQNFLRFNCRSNNNLSDLDSLEEVIRASCPLLGYHDPAVYELLQNGFTIGFDDLQLNNFRKLLMKLLPVELSDIIAVWPLFFSRSFMLGIEKEYFNRKNGLVDYSYLHPSLKEVLCDTYGIFLYNEQRNYFSL